MTGQVSGNNSQANATQQAQQNTPSSLERGAASDLNATESPNAANYLFTPSDPSNSTTKEAKSLMEKAVTGGITISLKDSEEGGENSLV